MTDLSGKVAFVSGASAGLGAHFAKTLALAGAEVIIAARREAELQKVADDIVARGGRCRGVALDVSDSGNVDQTLAACGKIDILVNNAGLVRDAAALDVQDADWDIVIDTNLKGSFLLARKAASLMREAQSGGSIINIASILGFRQAGGVLPYAVSKAGVIQLTKVLALELARFNIRVNALAPGYLETELNRAFFQSDAGRAMLRRIPQRRLGQLKDLDGPLLLLASDASAYMTGSVIVVDGGHLLSSL